VELSRNYNLIVIGNRGKGGLAERLLGTTSSSLPAYAYCPIVVVPFTDDEDKLLHLNNVITRVVVGSDESKWGLKALEIAADFANSWDADLTVLSAVPVYSASSGVFSLAPSQEETDKILASYLDDLKVRVEPIHKQYPNLVIRTEVVPGSAVDTLTHASSTNDVVVVGSRGRGGFTGLILGSTSQGLIQHATSPVYVVPRKYVEAAEREMDATPQSPADVPIKSLEDIMGVQKVEVPTGSHQQAEEIDTAIDPLRPDHDDSQNDHSDTTPNVPGKDASEE
jgi:nucleotide-binding universal stress UspA family protein